MELERATCLGIAARGGATPPSRILIGWPSQAPPLDWALAVPIAERPPGFPSLLPEGVRVAASRWPEAATRSASEDSGLEERFSGGPRRSGAPRTSRSHPARRHALVVQEVKG